MEGLVDLTGGLAERLTIKGPDPATFKKLQRAYRAGSYITCSITSVRDIDTMTANLMRISALRAFLHRETNGVRQ